MCYYDTLPQYIAVSTQYLVQIHFGILMDTTASLGGEWLYMEEWMVTLVWLYSSIAQVYNNCASTVLTQFMQAVQSYGWPCRVRSDQGLENIEVARAMIQHRGLGRRSHITVYVLWYGGYRLFRSIWWQGPFLFALHLSSRIQRQLQRFVHSWNRHPLRTEGNQSPITLWTDGIQEALHNPCDTSNS